jgi:hypothetical protein
VFGQKKMEMDAEDKKRLAAVLSREETIDDLLKGTEPFLRSTVTISIQDLFVAAAPIAVKLYRKLHVHRRLYSLITAGEMEKTEKLALRKKEIPTQADVQMTKNQKKNQRKKRNKVRQQAAKTATPVKVRISRILSLTNSVIEF